MGVRMTHPDVADEIYVHPDARAIHENSGWQVVPGQDDIGPDLPTDVARFEGQEQVRLRHPNVHDTIIVGRDAVGAHRSKGWVEVDEGDTAENQTLEDMTVEQLKDRIREVNQSRPDDDQLPVSGTKAELLERLQTTKPYQEPATPGDEEDEA